MAVTLATLQARLAEAEAAYHTLMVSGAAKVFVDQNGERIEYERSSGPRLAAYIESLKTQIRLLEGGTPSGPLSVWM